MVHVGDYITHDEVARKLVLVLLDDVLEPGDIVTHATSHQIGSLLDEDGNVLAAARRARERGVIFDAGVGIRNFTFNSARMILDQGFVPDTISSDLTVPGRQSPTHSLTECMNKFLALGLSLEDVVLRTTARPAEVLGMSEQLGSISPGREADPVDSGDCRWRLDIPRQLWRRPAGPARGSVPADHGASRADIQAGRWTTAVGLAARTGGIATTRPCSQMQMRGPDA